MTLSTDLSGKTALVTGASSGLGAHFARVLATAGATVVLAARRLDKLEALKTEIEASGGHANAVQMDVTSPESVTAAFEQIATPCDIVVNNSGIGQASWFINTEEEEWADIVETNLTGVWRVAQQATRALIAAGTPGSIINIASITAVQPALMNSGYAASKAAVEHLTRNMAVELARYNIRVNAISPGYFRTAINDTYLDSEAGDKLRQRIAMKRFGDYEDLDGALLLLASDAGAYMTGSTLIVDGGHTLAPL
ncbi:MAG: SDR family oxidoreductase [Henriciella sp.]|nr:SDR family oxidoreductase [Henriciella sp.]